MTYKTLSFVFTTVIAINVVVMYWLLFGLDAKVSQLTLRRSVSLTPASEEASDEPVVERNVTFVGPQKECDGCLERIEALEDAVAELEGEVSSQTPAVVTTTSSSTSQAVYVPLGSGEATVDEWTTISGANAYIDTANYSAISSARFEGTLRIPTGQGQAYARLYNATDKHPVWFSEVTTGSSGEIVFQSEPITLDSGNKLYEVQIKHSFGVRTVIDNARVQIVQK